MKHRADGTNPFAPLSSEALGLLDAAWQALEGGETEVALHEAETLLRRTRGHPEVRFLLGAALLDLGEPAAALEHLAASQGEVSDPELHGFYQASALFELARFHEAEALLRQVLETEEDQAPVLHALGEVLEHLGRTEEADTAYRMASENDREAYPPPLHVSRETFEEILREATESLPAELRSHLAEIPVVVEDLPGPVVLASATDDPISPAVLGIFVGRNLREESVFEIPGVPRSILIYQRNLERVCTSREELAREIRKTLYHELGHYLGLEEEELEARGME